MNIIFLTALLLIALTSCSNQKVDIKAEEEKLLQIWEDWQKLAATGDKEKAAFY